MSLPSSTRSSTLLGIALLLTAATHGAAAQSPPPSASVTSAINVVAQAGSSVDLNRWKSPNAVRADVDANLASMQKDLSTTLPPLLAASDAAPASAAAALPVLLNLDALYSVLLRVTIASRGGAPREQNTQLEQAAVTLDNARRDLGDRITAIAAATERKANSLQATVQQQADALKAAQAPPPPPPVTPKTPVKKKPAKPAATKPAPPKPTPAQ